MSLLHNLHRYLQRSLGSAIKIDDLISVLFPYFIRNARRHVSKVMLKKRDPVYRLRKARNKR